MKRANVRFKLFYVLVLVLCVLVGCGGSKDSEKKTPEPTAMPTDTPAPTDTPEPTATPLPLVNVAKGKPVTADHEETNDFTADKAVDGDEATRWSGFSLALENPMENYDRWLIVDLEKEYIINSFEIWFEFLAVSYKIEVSLTGEENSWTTVFDSDGVNPVGPNLIFEEVFEPVKARYVKFSTYRHEDQSPHSGYPFCSIYELIVMGYDESELNTI